ncbi:MAG: Ig-like domain-containing protein [Bacteroidetes bacterium]|nr:Ig-like domain-containing protein [Bacteroidota bacterium]
MRKFLFILPALLLFQCARQTQPNGGPKDVDPPQLLTSNPEYGQKNFSGETIELTFDEDIKLKDAKEEILITPSPGPKTKFVAKKKKVIITPENKWLENTTYSIAFREGIQDLNESNPAEDLHLAFSTGPEIDSLEIKGSIYEAFQEKIPEKITIALYQQDTFDIFKHKPAYFTKANKRGQFSIPNLKAGEYNIYAFDDKNKNLKVDSRSERFGFLSKKISLPEQSDSVKIEIIHLDSRPLKVTTVRNSATISTIRFNKPVDSLKIFPSQKPIIYTFGDTKAEVILHKDFDKKDSIQLRVFGQDSLQQKVDTSVYVKYSENKSIAEKFKVTDWNAKIDLVTNRLIAKTSVNKLIASITYDSIYIQIDSSTFQGITRNEILVDTVNRKLSINVKIKEDLKTKVLNPVLILGKGALVSIENDSSKAQDIKLKIPKSEEVGTLSIEVNTKEPYFEIQLLTADNKLTQSIRNTKKYTFTNLLPGEYKLLIIIDSNNNKKWDPGNFFKRIEPEKTLFYKSIENKFSFPIRANWEVGPLVITF